MSLGQRVNKLERSERPCTCPRLVKVVLAEGERKPSPPAACEKCGRVPAVVIIFEQVVAAPSPGGPEG